MKKDNVIQIKSYEFAVRVITFVSHIRKEIKEFELTRQLIRSGTSIGANVEEAIGSHTRKEFSSKITIAYREARETHYWLRLFRDGGLSSAETIDELIESCEEILRILGSIQKTTRKKDDDHD